MTVTAAVAQYETCELKSLHLNCRLHEFVWHGTDPTNKTRKIPGALKFIKLRVIPDQFYYNIEDVSVSVCVCVCVCVSECE